jgi:hypothetical protein
VSIRLEPDGHEPMPQWILANIGQKAADPHIGAAVMVLHRSILLMHFLDPKPNRLTINMH